jgi:serine O-acetyltransferase
VDVSSVSLRAYVAADMRRFHRTMRGDVPLGARRALLYLLSPRFAPMLLCRIANAFSRHGLAPVGKLVSLINFVFFGIEIATRCRIGPGLFLPHTQGTVIGAASVGANATIYQGVTIGARELDAGYFDENRPVIGDNVLIGSGAKVLGPIQIGDGVRIGANSVILDSLPAGALAVGASTRVIERKAD